MRNIEVIFIPEFTAAFKTPLKCDNLEVGILMCSLDSFKFLKKLSN